MERNSTRDLARTAVFTALVAAATMAVQVPMPATEGFVNVGDTVIFVTALLLGPVPALAAGGLGSALADLLTGYAHWAPWTLVIKGIEGWIAGAVGYLAFHQRGSVFGLPVLGMAAAAAWMVAGYLGAGAVMYGLPVALTSVPGNLVQGGLSVVAATALAAAVSSVARRYGTRTRRL
ncbi:MAG: ECF transporter S component [Thermaerobacter sp.]